MAINFAASQCQQQEQETLNEKKYSLTFKEISLIIDKVKAKTLFDLNFSASQVRERLLNKKHTLKTLYKWKRADWNVESFICGKSTGRKSKITTTMRKRILKYATVKKYSIRQISRSIRNAPSYPQIAKALRKQGLRPYRKRVVGKLSAKNIAMRLKWAKDNKNQPLSHWESMLITDSKMFLLNGGRNSQNNVQWAYSPEDLPQHEVEKFDEKLHVYGGMSAKGLTDLIFVEGNVTAQKYVNNILPKLVNNHQSRRKTKGNVTEIKLFDNPKVFIFEQDHAKVHDSNIAQSWCQQHINQFLDKTATPPKLDDFWPIERVWAIMTQMVYKEPRPKTLVELKRRIILNWSKIHSGTLLKLVHEMPLRLQQIESNKGRKITDMKLRCLCDLCAAIRSDIK